MFTGIVSHIGKVEHISHPNDWELAVSVPKTSQLENVFDFDKIKIGASIACSGICLTLKKNTGNILFFDVSDETASKTNFLNWKVGTIINLEKSLKVGDELGGHFVYGHVDTISKIKSIEKINGSYKITFIIQDEFIKYFSPDRGFPVSSTPNVLRFVFHIISLNQRDDVSFFILIKF